MPKLIRRVRKKSNFRNKDSKSTSAGIKQKMSHNGHGGRKSRGFRD